MEARILDRRGRGRGLVFIPGIDGSGRMTLGLEERLAADFDVVRLAYEPSGDDTYPALAASVAACIRASGLERPLLLAESFGGAVAIQTALDHPDVGSALALVNTFCRYPNRARLRLGTWVTPLTPAAFYRWSRRRFGFGLMFGRLGTDAERAAFDRLVPDFFDRALARRMRMILSLDQRARLGEITWPAEIFVSDRDRVLDSPRAAEAMHRGLRNATVRPVAGGGHLILPVRALPWPEWLRALAERAE